MPKFSVKKPFVVLVAVIMVLVLGIVSFTRMTTDFLPNMNLPYMMIITTYPGASPEKVQRDVTEPMESGTGTVNGVKNVTSQSMENASLVTLEFEEDTNMDAAMVKVSSAVNQLELPDTAGNPMIMELSMDMMATMIASVDYEGKDRIELSKFVEDVVIPELQRQDGVASVSESGNVIKSIEVVLNQDKIDSINEEVLAKTDKTLAKARKDIDKAKKELEKGKKELEKQKKNLEEEQNKQSAELAKFSKMMNEAIATKTAYNSQLTSLKASQTALETEKKAYKDNGVVEAYNQMNDMMKALRNSLSEDGEAYKAIYDAAYKQISIAIVQGIFDSAGMEMEITEENIDQYLEQYLPQFGDTADEYIKQAEEQAKQVADTQAQAQLDVLPESVKDAIDNPDKLEALKKLMEAQEQQEAVKNLTKKNLSMLYDIVETRIPQIDIALGNLKTEIAAAEAIVKQVTKSIAEAEKKYEQVESGKITAAAAFGSANAQISSVEATLENSESELKSAEKSFKESKKQALENANLDALLTMEQISNILTAENFSMPAGYISEDETQYLIKVGDEYSSVDEMTDAVLCNIDDIGDIKLSDVADINMVDNSADSYGKVNGNDAVLLSISKSSTAGTSDVSDACNDAFKKMSEENEGLRFTNLMDQGDYIRLIIDSVLSNLLWGALLAIIVLLIFLKDIRPTVVVAFSIPLSVLFAVVLMYFTDITLNIISLSGLALGVGMLVDNSIVVVENIYRLRSKGVGAARAAVMGANQVAGAIFSSTLTTICVFLPIIFTDGITRQIMQDMCLTITYSLCASLVVALTVVPSMGATVLNKADVKKHRWFDALVNVYDKAIRFCLRFKIVPIIIAIGLLVFSTYKVLKMGIVFVPDMGSEQMSVSYTMPDDTSTEEDYKLSDEIASEIQKIKGVNTIGTMLSSATSVMGSVSSDTKAYSAMILLDEEYANKNKEIAADIEKILESKKLEDYSVSESNMDMSSMMGSGLEVDIYGKDLDKLLKISEDVKEMVESIEGFEEVSNGQEKADKELVVQVNKKKAMRLGLTVAQVYAELAAKLSTDKDSTSITVNEEEFDVKIVDEREELNTKNIMDYEFETTTTNDKGEQKKEKHKLKEFAKLKEGTSIATINRENIVNYMAVTAVAEENYNTTLLSRDLEKLIDQYNVPDGYEIKIAGESETNNEMVSSMLTMIGLAIIFIYLVMVAQFGSLLSPFIILLTIPLAFTGGLIALLVTGEEISVMALMGFLVLSGVVVNNGIVFVDYANKLRLDGKEKKDALIETGKTRMRPIMMTALTTILAMSVMAASQDSTAAMSRGMAIVTIGGLIYATFMTLFIVPVLYDIFYRKKLKKVDLGDEETLNETDDII